MLKLFLTLIFTAIFSTGFFTKAAFAEAPPVISVSGSSVVESAPDQATIRLGVVTRAKKADEAQSENAAAGNAIHRALNKLGIADRDVRTDGYNFHPDYIHEEKGQPRLVGYTVSNSVIVRVRDVSMVGSVIDAALSSGANSVDSLDFSIENTDALRREALVRAVRDAEEKAEIIAAALKKRIVGVQNVSENTHSFRPSANRGMMMAKLESAAMDGATGIEAGTLSLSADVHIDFIIEN